MGEYTDVRTASGEAEYEVEDPKWTLAKSLLQVNEACDRTLEQLLLYSTRDVADGYCADQLESQLEHAIHRHEEVLEQLELARRALAESK
jgi:hypothetical protein